jgi:DNA-binding XRE family transcriptional regulator
MNHQNFDITHIINPKKQKVEKNIEQRKGDTSIKDELKKLDDNNEVFSIQKIPRALSKELINFRIKLKYTQKDIAQKLNIQQNIYNELENGKALYNNQNKILINKIENILKVKFENKKVD